MLDILYISFGHDMNHEYVYKSEKLFIKDNGQFLFSSLIIDYEPITSKLSVASFPIGMVGYLDAIPSGMASL